MNRSKIAVIGECMIEVSGQQNLKQGFGGDTLNTAVYLTRQTLDANFDVFYITALGVDRFSDQMINSWTEEGIDTSFVQRLPGRLPGLILMTRGSARFTTGERAQPQDTGYPLSKGKGRATHLQNLMRST